METNKDAAQEPRRGNYVREKGNCPEMFCSDEILKSELLLL